jgi:threonine/homoserine/homoserine lactone efflux protein
MNSPQALLAFTLAASVLTIAPGVDTALVLRHAAGGGPRPAAFAAIGIAVGCLIWGAAVSIGLGALLAASEIAFTLMKWLGAAYLSWLGVKLILRPRSDFDLAPATTGSNGGQSLRQGLLTNLLNPKVGVFYVSFLPQFIPAGANVPAFSLLLAAIHVALGLAWFAILIAATVPLGRVLRRPRVIEGLDRATGGVFLLFGAKLALSRS